MNRSKKLSYGLAIGLAAMALLVDRLSGWRVTSGTAEAIAASSASSPRTVNTSGGGADESRSLSETMVVRTPFPTRLPDYEPERDRRDVFALTSVARAAVFSKPSGAAINEAVSTSDEENGALKAAAFKQQHSLWGVMLQREGGYAIVGGKWIQVGESLDGCTLTRLDGDRAYFACMDGEAELSVDRETGDS